MVIIITITTKEALTIEITITTIRIKIGILHARHAKEKDILQIIAEHLNANTAKEWDIQKQIVHHS